MKKQTEMNNLTPDAGETSQVNDAMNEGETPPTAKKHRKSSSMRAASQWRSAVNHVRAHSHKDVEGNSPLANTGPFIDYDDV
jgi:hypothetical protein